ncbi:quercetin 2,3-dioxygenase [Bdellovibrio sp. qaytius]|nr:quercetin 2,3-dioxygenase [Bdellovibrio sp. qaytius]
MKKILHIQRSDTPHWVGDGFPVRTIFTYQDLAPHMSPFLLMDYAGPVEFTPSEHRRGVGEHPHRGFETVTIVYSGEVEHRDSSGGGGLIKAGDVQWMTAASGLVHEEKHGADFAKNGGLFEMVQLWVNLPKKDKMNKPRYQGIRNSDIPEVLLQGGKLRVIAGSYLATKGPAITHSEMNLWDMRLAKGSKNIFSVPEGHTASVFVLSGSIKLNEDKTVGAAELALMETAGQTFEIEALEDTKMLFLGGAPLNEPIVGYGPFVMNSQMEIRQAFDDFESGKMGRL